MPSRETMMTGHYFSNHQVGFSVTEKTQLSNMCNPYDFRDCFSGHFDFFAGEGTHISCELRLWPEDDQVLQSVYDKNNKKLTCTLRTGEAMLGFLDQTEKAGGINQGPTPVDVFLATIGSCHGAIARMVAH